MLKLINQDLNSSPWSVEMFDCDVSEVYVSSNSSKC